MEFILAIVLISSAIAGISDFFAEHKRRINRIKLLENETFKLHKEIKELKQKAVEEATKKYFEEKEEEHKAIIRDFEEKEKFHQANIEKLLSSNLQAMPWLAGMMADFLTYDIEVLAKKLDWGSNHERAKKVASIREIRAEAKRRIEEAKIATYQLEYLKQLYPSLEDVIETNFSDLEFTKEIPDYDPIRPYLGKEEWVNLSDTQKNQLALDRYIESRKKSKWQIGRDYELSVAYEYLKKGYVVDTQGSYKGLEDMGRDIIAQKDGTFLIIQCKYWSQEKTIHEKHIFQLFGTMVSFCLENNYDKDFVKGVFVTNITCSETAKRMAQYLGIAIVENHKIVDFPRIKCNLGYCNKKQTKIYHLPMDEQYDSIKIDKKGEFFAFTVSEAENAGFRRAYKYFK